MRASGRTGFVETPTGSRGREGDEEMGRRDIGVGEAGNPPVATSGSPEEL